MISTARPEQGTRAGSVHDLVWRLRAAATDSDRPGRALAMARQLDADTARAALIVAIVSERWPTADRAAMKAPYRDTSDSDDQRALRDVIRSDAFGRHPRKTGKR